MYVNDMDPYEEAQHILEVLQRNTARGSVKGVNEDKAIIQIEQVTRSNANRVIEELIARGYRVVSPLTRIGNGWTAGIEKVRERRITTKEMDDGR